MRNSYACCLRQYKKPPKRFKRFQEIPFRYPKVILHVIHLLYEVDLIFNVSVQWGKNSLGFPSKTKEKNHKKISVTRARDLNTGICSFLLNLSKWDLYLRQCGSRNGENGFNRYVNNKEKKVVGIFWRVCEVSRIAFLNCLIFSERFCSHLAKLLSYRTISYSYPAKKLCNFEFNQKSTWFLLFFTIIS